MSSPKLKTIALKLLAFSPMILVTLSLVIATIGFSLNHQQTLANGHYEERISLLSSNSNTCGGTDAVHTSINFGCKGKGNPITDLLFAIIRFLSAGVGLIVIASVIVGGIQYIVARGDPNSTSKAINRLVSSIIALIIFIFAYAILNYVIPGGIFL